MWKIPNGYLLSFNARNLLSLLSKVREHNTLQSTIEYLPVYPPRPLIVTSVNLRENFRNFKQKRQYFYAKTFVHAYV